MSATWTPEQDAILTAGWGRVSAAKIAAQIGSVTPRAVIARASRMKMPRLKPGCHTASAWTAKEDAFLIANRGVLSSTLIARELGKTKGAVVSRAHRLSLPCLPFGDPPQHLPRGIYIRKPHKYRAMAARAQPVEPLNIPYFDLQPFHCREIVGTGEDGLPLSCGHPKVGGKKIPWFCAWHMRENCNPAAMPAKAQVYWPTFGKRKMVAA